MNAQSSPTLIYDAQWEGITFKLRYKPNWLGFMAHIEVFANEPLPITETGYRSIFFYKEEMEQGRGVVALIEAMLNHHATSKEWIHHLQNRKQLSLF